jgi:hypothetical protein
MCEGILWVSGKESFTNPTRGKKPNGARRVPAQLTPISFEVRSCILVRVVAMTSAGNGCPIENRLVILPTKLFVCVQGGQVRVAGATRLRSRPG